MDELKEKEYYKKFITEMINNIDDVNMLAYLHTFIALKCKVNDTDNK